jgi:hypothetical protein
MSEVVEYRFERKIRVGNSKVQGRGVFATEDIK